MTQEEIIEIAREAGLRMHIPFWSDSEFAVALELFASLVTAKEREACAKLADEYATWGGSNFYSWFKKLATAIRARGEQA